MIKFIKYICGYLATITEQLMFKYFILVSSFTVGIVARISTYKLLTYIKQNNLIKGYL